MSIVDGPLLLGPIFSGSVKNLKDARFFYEILSFQKKASNLTYSLLCTKKSF